MSEFDAVKVKDACVNWVHKWFDENGADCNALVAISGGKDSTVVAGLCTEALGKDRVIGILMPNGIQKDFADAEAVVEHLGIKSYTANIFQAYNAINILVNQSLGGDVLGRGVSEQTRINLPARVRMVTLYAFSQSLNGRVANTCNLSEDWIGYSTKYGDAAGDFSPLAKLTVTEVIQVGLALGLPEGLVRKTPSDGLCGKTDEDRFGFTYEVLDRYIRTGEINDLTVKEKIDVMHKANLFKLKPMPCFEYDGRIIAV